MLYSMPAIYIQLAGERTHFTLLPLLSPFSASLKLTRAFQVRNWHRLLGAATVLHVQRATIAATCVLICSERFALMPRKCQGWPRCCGAAGAAGDVAARRAHDAALNCRIVCVSLSAGREIA